MSQFNHLFTSESVSRGHPDKVCDQISDAILDEFLTADNESRVACETLATMDRVVVAGEVRGPQDVMRTIEEVARVCVRDIGYEQEGFHWNTFEFENYLHEQSPDIAQGVDQAGEKDEGAGDQGLMFGFAIDETPELMPAPIHYAHRVLESLDRARSNNADLQLGPDAKSQLTFEYRDGKPAAIRKIVISTQHLDESLDSEDVKEIVKPIVSKALPKDWLSDTVWLINPTGRFVIGGPAGDCGLTGRKIIVDTYGGSAPHGGGAFSGKDPTKVDRSAAYAARYLAKNVVASGLAEKCLIQISYAIGKAEPTSFFLQMFDTHKACPEAIQRKVLELMPLTPRNIREHLALNAPIYRRTAAYGHFGRAPRNNGEFTWERTDLTEELRSIA